MGERLSYQDVIRKLAAHTDFIEKLLLMLKSKQLKTEQEEYLLILIEKVRAVTAGSKTVSYEKLIAYESVINEMKERRKSAKTKPRMISEEVILVDDSDSDSDSVIEFHPVSPKADDPATNQNNVGNSSSRRRSSNVIVPTTFSLLDEDRPLFTRRFPASQPSIMDEATAENAVSERLSKEATNSRDPKINVPEPRRQHSPPRSSCTNNEKLGQKHLDSLEDKLKEKSLDELNKIKCEMEAEMGVSVEELIQPNISNDYSHQASQLPWSIESGLANNMQLLNAPLPQQSFSEIYKIPTHYAEVNGNQQGSYMAAERPLFPAKPGMFENTHPNVGAFPYMLQQTPITIQNIEPVSSSLSMSAMVGSDYVQTSSIPRPLAKSNDPRLQNRLTFSLLRPSTNNSSGNQGEIQLSTSRLSEARTYSQYKMEKQKFANSGAERKLNSVSNTLNGQVKTNNESLRQDTNNGMVRQSSTGIKTFSIDSTSQTDEADKVNVRVKKPKSISIVLTRKAVTSSATANSETGEIVHEHQYEVQNKKLGTHVKRKRKTSMTNVLQDDSNSKTGVKRKQDANKSLEKSKKSKKRKCLSDSIAGTNTICDQDSTHIASVETLYKESEAVNSFTVPLELQISLMEKPIMEDSSGSLDERLPIDSAIKNVTPNEAEVNNEISLDKNQNHKRKKNVQKSGKTISCEWKKLKSIQRKSSMYRELRSLHDDIDQMYCRDEILSATGKRSCTTSTNQKISDSIEAFHQNSESVNCEEVREWNSSQSNYFPANEIDYEDRLRLIEICQNVSLFVLLTKCDEVLRPDEDSDLLVPFKEIMDKTKRISRRQSIHAARKLNIDKSQHYRSSNAEKCCICRKKPMEDAQTAIDHYVNMHQKSEVFIARLPQIDINFLMKKGIFADTFIPAGATQELAVEYRGLCVFCKKELSGRNKFWYEHFSSHTGEFSYECDGCNKKFPVMPELLHYCGRVDSPARVSLIYRYNFDKKDILAFYCKICNYVQLNRGNIVRHLEREHNCDATATDSNAITIPLLQLKSSTVRIKDEPTFNEEPNLELSEYVGEETPIDIFKEEMDYFSEYGTENTRNETRTCTTLHTRTLLGDDDSTQEFDANVQATRNSSSASVWTDFSTILAETIGNSSHENLASVNGHRSDLPGLTTNYKSITHGNEPSVVLPAPICCIKTEKFESETPRNSTENHKSFATKRQQEISQSLVETSPVSFSFQNRFIKKEPDDEQPHDPKVIQETQSLFLKNIDNISSGSQQPFSVAVKDGGVKDVIACISNSSSIPINQNKVAGHIIENTTQTTDGSAFSALKKDSLMGDNIDEHPTTSRHSHSASDRISLKREPLFIDTDHRVPCLKLLKTWRKVSISKKTEQICEKMLNEKSLFAFYKCMGDTCHYTTNSKPNFVEHLQSHRVEKSLDDSKPKAWQECSYCDFVAENNDLIEHLNSHISSIYQCSLCFYRNRTPTGWKLHLELHHDGSRQGRIFKCGDGVKDDEKRMQEEARLIIKPFVCKVCKKKFYNKNLYILHMRFENPLSDVKSLSELLPNFSCAFCKFDAIRLKDLRHHLVINHITKVPFFVNRKSEFDANLAYDGEDSAMLLTFGIDSGDFVHEKLFKHFSVRDKVGNKL